MEERKRIWHLLDRFTAGQCDDGELEELFNYMSSDRYNHIQYDHILKTLKSPALPGNSLDASRSEVIIHKILSLSRANKTIIRSISPKKPIVYIMAAAAMVAAVALILWFALPGDSSIHKQKPLVASLQTNSRHIVNNTTDTLQVRLADGSRVVLQPTSALTYFTAVDGPKREVILEGDAFFDIARNPEKPFLVYHGNLITRVLGTSFNIRYKNTQREAEAEVDVIRGKVEVYENSNLKVRPGKNNGVIITPNQRVIYTEENRIFSTSLVDKPMPVAVTYDAAGAGPGPAAAQSPAAFRFEKTRMEDILQLLQKTYDIEIDLESKAIANCQFSGDISDQNLFSKLDILCQAMGIGYEVKGTRILLTGKGCQ